MSLTDDQHLARLPSTHAHPPGLDWSTGHGRIMQCCARHGLPVHPVSTQDWALHMDRLPHLLCCMMPPRPGTDGLGPAELVPGAAAALCQYMRNQKRLKTSKQGKVSGCWLCVCATCGPRGDVSAAAVVGSSPMQPESSGFCLLAALSAPLLPSFVLDTKSSGTIGQI